MKNIYLMADDAAGGGGSAPAAGATGGAAAGSAASGTVLGSGATAQTPADWRASLPDDLKADASLAAIKDIPSLAKSYVHAQKLVGADKIPAPQKNWTPEQWNEHYERIGRPKDAKEYGFPADFKAPEGIKLDDAALSKARDTFYKAGLTKSQGETILAFYGNTLAEGQALQEAAIANARVETMSALEKEWKTETQLNLQLAQSAMMKYGGNELKEYLEATGLGNNAALIKCFAAIGKRITEDGVGGAGLVLPTSASAQQELSRLQADPEFQKALNDNRHPNHKSAVDKRLQLFRLSQAG